MITQGLWKGCHPHLWGATEFYHGDILALDLALILDQRDRRMFDPWEGLRLYKRISLHVVVSNLVIL